jgi:nitroreductase
MKTIAPDALEPWRVAAKDFPHDGSTEEKLHFLLRYAVLAPSSHNTQPWLFRVRDSQVELYADRTRSLHVVDPDDRELIISCGAALFHLRLATQHFGYLGAVQILPESGDPDLLARVRLGLHGETSVQDNLLFQAIPKRRTNRMPFSADPVPEALLAALVSAAASEDAWLQLVRMEDDRYAIADLVAEGDRMQWSNKRFRLELAAWIHRNSGKRQNGIPGYAQSIDDLMSHAGPLVVRTFDLGEGQAAKDREVATGSPVLAVLGTKGDSVSDWIAAGQALAKVLLRARVEDVWASFLNQPIEVIRLRAQVADVIHATGHPQLILRLGFGMDIKPAPRRGVDDVLI